MGKAKPIHALKKLSHTVLLTTWCLVDPYRKGVRTDAGGDAPTCQGCLRAKRLAVAS